jgi:hypothetical protein
MKVFKRSYNVVEDKPEISLNMHSLPKQIYAICKRYLYDELTSSIEHLFLITYTNREVIGIYEINIGDSWHCCCDPELIIGKTIEDKALGITLVHNHPSFNSKFSPADYNHSISIHWLFRLLGKQRLISEMAINCSMEEFMCLFIFGDEENREEYRINAEFNKSKTRVKVKQREFNVLTVFGKLNKNDNTIEITENYPRPKRKKNPHNKEIQQE